MAKVIVNTNLGNIQFELLSDIAPETVRNFINVGKVRVLRWNIVS